MCHTSRFTCHVSIVTCHMSHINLIFFFFFFDKVVKLIGGGSVINGAYPSSLFYERRLYLLTFRHSSAQKATEERCLLNFLAEQTKSYDSLICFLPVCMWEIGDVSVP